MKAEYQEMPPEVQRAFLLKFERQVIIRLARMCGIPRRIKKIESLVSALVESGKLNIRADISIGLKDESLDADVLRPPVDPHLSAERHSKFLRQQKDWNRSIEIVGETSSVDCPALVPLVSPSHWRIPQ